jgi:peptidyl-prolyl cis-trans isomerase C
MIVSSRAMRLAAVTALGFGLLAVASLPTPALAQDATVATINGATITETDLTSAMEEFEQQLARVPEAERKKVTLERIIDMRIIAQAAAKDGLDKDPTVLRRLESIRVQLLTSEYVRKKVEAAITDDDLKARYEKEMAAYTAPEEVKASHILVETKEQADEVMKELAAGKAFADIAKEKSIDPGSKENGGDLGYFQRGQMVPEFEQAAFGLEKGAVTKEPVQTQFGFHIIKQEDKRAGEKPAFDAVKDQVREVVAAEKFREALAALRKDAKIDYNDATLKPAAQ